MQPTPPVGGQYVVLYPTSIVSGGQTGSGQVIPPTEIFSGGFCALGGSGTLVASGFTLPAYINPASVTAVYAFAFSQNYPLTGSGTCFSSPKVPITWSLNPFHATATGTGAVSLLPSTMNPDGSWDLQQTTSTLFGVTGANIPTTAITATALLSGDFKLGSEFDMPTEGLIVYYTGPAPPANTEINVAPPLSLANNTLSISDLAQFPGSYLVPYTVAQARLAATGMLPDALLWVYDGSSATDCTTGGGTSKVLCVWDGVSALTAFSAGGSGTIATTNLMFKGDNAGNAIASTVANPTCAGCAGGIGLAQGTAPAIIANNVLHYAPTSVTGYRVVDPGAASSGLLLWANSSNTVTESILAEVDGNCVIGSSGVWVAGSCSGGGGSSGGTVTYTSNQTASTSDNGKLVIMDCSSACAYTLPDPQPSSTWFAAITSQGATLATVTLGGSTWNGVGSAPSLTSFDALWAFANTSNSDDYSGSASLIAGANVTLTPASNGLTVAASGGGGGTSNPSTCTVNSATDICLPLAPYYASTAGATATTTSGTFGVGTSGSVASCSTFLANEGVLIVGAGTAGANYIGTVVSCTGTTLTVTPTTVTSVAGSTVVQHDETAAFLAAITALNPGSGTIWLPDGIYLVNGPLLDTSGANAILPMPKIPNYTLTNLVDISIKGFTLPNWDTFGQGAIIQTASNTGNLIGGYDSASGGGYPNFTNVKLELENITFRLPVNPGIVAVNGTNLLALQPRHIFISTGSGSVPSNTAGGGIFMPTLSNEVQLEMQDINVAAVYTPYILTEHTTAIDIYAGAGVNCFVFDTGARSGSFVGNSINVTHMWSQQCTNFIVAGSNPTTFNITNADIELLSGLALNDPSNLLHGTVAYINASDSPTRCTFPTSGGTHVVANCLYNPSVVFNGGEITNPLSIGGAVTAHPLFVYGSGSVGPAVFEGGSGELELWKDTTPTKALSFGLNVPGSSGGNDWNFSAYDGSAWHGWMKIANSNGAISTPNATLDNGSGAATHTNVTDSALTSGNCVQAGSGGLLGTTSGPCGGSYFNIGSAVTFTPSGSMAGSFSGGVFTVSTAGTVLTITGIPSTYLNLYVKVKGTIGATNVIGVQFNGDTGGHYNWGCSQVPGSAPSVLAGCGGANSATSIANAFLLQSLSGQGTLEVDGYTDSFPKAVDTYGSYWTSLSSGTNNQQFRTWGLWDPTSQVAITSITLTCGSNCSVGDQFMVYASN